MLEPCENNAYLAEHVALLFSSLKHWTGRSLVDSSLSSAEQARHAFMALYALLSHDTAEDPIFNYGNKTALRLWETTWDHFTTMPSRLTAEPQNRKERARLLEGVQKQGFVDDYSGIRITTSGQRFSVERATVWNVIDNNGRYCGQAAVLFDWTFI